MATLAGLHMVVVADCVASMTGLYLPQPPKILVLESDWVAMTKELKTLREANADLKAQVKYMQGLLIEQAKRDQIPQH